MLDPTILLTVKGIVPCPCTAKSFKGNGTPSLGGNKKGPCGPKKTRGPKSRVSRVFLSEIGYVLWRSHHFVRLDIFLVRLDILRFLSINPIFFLFGDFLGPVFV